MKVSPLTLLAVLVVSASSLYLVSAVNHKALLNAQLESGSADLYRYQHSRNIDELRFLADSVRYYMDEIEESEAIESGLQSTLNGLLRRIKQIGRGQKDSGSAVDHKVMLNAQLESGSADLRNYQHCTDIVRLLYIADATRDYIVDIGELEATKSDLRSTLKRVLRRVKHVGGDQNLTLVDKINDKLDANGADLVDYEKCTNFERLCYIVKEVRNYIEQKGIMSHQMEESGLQSILQGVVDRIEEIGRNQNNCPEQYL